MLNRDIPISVLEQLKLLVLDSDGVCVERGTKICEWEEGDKYKISFETNKVSDSLAKKINKLSEKLKVVICSGRSLMYLQSIYDKVEAEVLMAENGNLQFFSKINHIHNQTYNDKYFRKLKDIKKEIKKLPIIGFEPKQFILTVHVKKELKEVYQIVNKYDIDRKLKVLWNGEAFDIQHIDMSKGSAVSKLIRHFGYTMDNVIAIGDRMNDLELVRMAKVGVSADIEKLSASYFTLGKKLGGEVLVDYLLESL